MADAYFCKPAPAQTSPVPVPTPVSLCPQCGRVSVRDSLYDYGGLYEAAYACAVGHEWQTVWPLLKEAP